MSRSRHRRFVAFLAVVAPALLSAGLLVASAVPAQAIAVLTQSPVPGEEVVRVGTNVSVAFDVQAVGVSATTFTLAPPAGGAVPAAVTGAGASWTLNPDADLRPGTTYTATLTSGITDTATVALAQTSWSFTTDAPPADTTAPTVTARSPGGDARGVGTEVSPSATFSEAVQGVSESTFTLERTATGAAVSAVVFRRGTTNRWSLSPDDVLLEDARYTVRLDGGPTAIRDLANNPLADTSWSFRTGPGADAPGPRVVARFPVAGATGVNRLTDVRVRFSESVRRVNDTTFTLTDTRTGRDVPAGVFRNGSSRQWVLDPDRSLRRGTRYVVTLFGGRFGIRDLDGVALPSTRWSFRTRF
jgi:hypothetical protein